MARSKRTRTTLAEGVYLDAHGVSVIARLGSGKNLITAPPVRFPLVDESGIPYSRKNNAELVKCRLQLMEDLKRKRADAGDQAGTVGAAIDEWKIEFPLLLRTNGKPETDGKRADDHRLVAHWRKSPLAALPVEDLKRSQVRAQLQAWIDGGRAASSVNHRKRILGDVLRWALGADDDDDITVATDGIARFAEPEPEARGILMPILARILATMPDRGRAVKGEKRADYSETKIRLRVMSWTGLARQSLIRLERRHVNHREGKVYLPARKKGTGVAGVWVDALPPALDALRDYDRAGLWGKTFSRSSMRKSWRVAIENTRKALVTQAEQTDDLDKARDAKVMLEQFLATVPPNCKPYDTRHSFLSDAYRQTGDIKAVMALGQQRSIKTTERYTKAAVPERVALAVEKMRARWFPDVTKPGATVREFHVVPSTK